MRKYNGEELNKNSSVHEENVDATKSSDAIDLAESAVANEIADVTNNLSNEIKNKYNLRSRKTGGSIDI